MRPCMRQVSGESENVEMVVEVSGETGGWGRQLV